MKKTISIIIVLSFILSVFTGCSPSVINNGDVSSSASNSAPLKIAFCLNDEINPYKCKTVFNSYVSNLLYDPLIRVDNNYNLEYFIAESVSLFEKTCTVKIKNVLFSDGTDLTADDVIYSVECAKKSKSSYSYLFDNVLSVTKSDSKTVIFSLKDYDINFPLLLEFPIIKNQTGDMLNEGNLEIPPIGCGKYTINKSSLKLVANAGYYKEEVKRREIFLVDTPDMEALNSAVNMNNISVWPSYSIESDSVVLSGGITRIQKNNLVYLGMNLTKFPLSNPSFRYALNVGINREAITKDVFQNYANPATGIYNPKWSSVSSLQKNPTVNDNNIFVANLNEMGYNEKDNSGYYVQKSGKRLSLKILYCSDNPERSKLISQVINQFRSLGIEITATPKSYADYITALENQDFDLYIGETKFLNNMDISSLVCEDGSIAYGYEKKSPQEEVAQEETNSNVEKTDVEEEVIAFPMKQILADYNSGKIELYEVINTFNIQLPIIPICYKTGIISWQKGIEGVEIIFPGDPYYCLSDSTVQ